MVGLSSAVATSDMVGPNHVTVQRPQGQGWGSAHGLASAQGLTGAIASGDEHSASMVPTSGDPGRGRPHVRRHERVPRGRGRRYQRDDAGERPPRTQSGSSPCSRRYVSVFTGTLRTRIQASQHDGTARERGADLEMAQQERPLVEPPSTQPAGDLVVALAGVARTARRHHVVERVAAPTGDRQHAVALQWTVGRAAVRAPTPRRLQRHPLLGGEVVLDTLHPAAPTSSSTFPATPADSHPATVGGSATRQGGCGRHPQQPGRRSIVPVRPGDPRCSATRLRAPSSADCGPRRLVLKRSRPHRSRAGDLRAIGNVLSIRR